MLLTLLAFGCKDSTDPGPVPTTIELSTASLTVADGESVRLTAQVRDQYGAALPLPPGMALTWSSSDAAIATAAGGFITGNRPGTALITASVGSASATATVSVTQVATALQPLRGIDQHGLAGEELADSLAVRVVDRHGVGVPGVQVIWEVTGGEGVIAGATAASDGGGVARAAWRLGALGGTQSVIARSPAIGGSVAVFSATAGGGADAAFITSITPAVLVAGQTAVISGGNFDALPSALSVTIAGVPAAVTEATPERLTIRLPAAGLLPCHPIADGAVHVTSRGFTAVRNHPLRVGIERTLAVGETVILSGAADLACNELAGGRYLLSAFNSSRSLAASASVELKGSAGVGASMSSMPNAVLSRDDTGARAPRVGETVGTAASHARIMQANREILNALAPAFRQQMAATRSLSVAASPSVGDTASFRVPKLSVPNNQLCSSYDVVRGRVVYAGSRAVIYEDVGSPLAGTMDGDYQSIGLEYEQRMHPLLIENFGDPLALGGRLANSQQVYMLFTPAVRDNAPNVAGFVFSGDLFTREQCASSDRVAIFYAAVPTDAAAGFNGDTRENWSRTMRSTIIHEVKHITSFAERLNRDATTWEEIWLEEATARISEELWARVIFGYAHRGRAGYRQSIYCEVRPTWPECSGSPYVMLKHFSGFISYLGGDGTRTPLGQTNANDFSFYGSGWSLVRWAVDQSSTSEAAFLRALNQEPHLSGIANLEARANRSFAGMLPLWSLGMAVSDIPGFVAKQPAISFPSWNVADIFSGLTADFPTGFPATAKLRVNVGAGSFSREPVALRAGAATVLEMQGSSARRTVQLRGTSGLEPAATVGLAIVRIN